MRLSPVALASLATAAFDVEAEASRLVPALARFRQHGVQIANQRKKPGIGGGIRPRRAPDGRLVDADHLVDQLDALDRLVRAGLLVRAVDFPSPGCGKESR